MSDKEIFTPRELLRNIAARLRNTGAGNPESEAEMILMSLTGYSRADLYMRENVGLPPGKLAEILERRRLREPLQYILGEAYFMNLRLEVAPGVLIPRPETELLVERICREAPLNGRICDIGTGSGAIALAAAHERPDLEVIAADISADACRIAGINRKRLRLDRVRVIRSDLFSAIDGCFDVVAANLPYIGEAEYAGLQPEVRDYEPKSALVSGPDGLDLIRRIVREAPARLFPGGFLILEIGAGQGAAAAALLAGDFENVEIIRDYNGLDRHVAGTKK